LSKAGKNTKCSKCDSPNKKTAGKTILPAEMVSFYFTL
jgi:hypothetical protein